MQVLNGVHQIKSPCPGDASWYTNVYVIEGGDSHIMVDCGWDSQESLWALQEGIKAANLKLRDIAQVVITHIHPDHYGLSSKIKQICGAQVAIHRIDAGFISPRYKDFTNLLEKTEELLRQNGVPDNELPQLKEASVWMNKYVTADTPEVKLEDGDTISNDSFEFEVLWTPGHSPGHICLYERERRFILTGDHVLYETTPHVGLNPQSGDDPLGNYISSLKKLERLKVHFILPGHGPMFNALGLRIERILQHHEERKRAIMQALRDGMKTAYEIAQQIPWMIDEGRSSFQDLAVWDRRMAVTETLAHLRLLMEEDRVGNVAMDGASLYLSKD
ncbi:MAG: MBL fold metallo-hydrolase [Chloroflexota bacterium]|jgi:glyoxylase-like metal-dependent hydrolase (beta-lactamase superfamily II)|nr:MAG: MBL fold metallo-hydrolase [Chloroflexota bacterium]